MMRKFEPTDEQKRFVMLMACANLSYEAMASCIHNPRTKKPINVETLQKAFREELKSAKAELQKEVLSQYYKRLRDGDWNAIKFGLYAFCGFKPTENNGVTLALGAESSEDKTIVVVGVRPSLGHDREQPKASLTHDTLVDADPRWRGRKINDFR